MSCVKILAVNLVLLQRLSQERQQVQGRTCSRLCAQPSQEKAQHTGDELTKFAMEEVKERQG